MKRMTNGAVSDISYALASPVTAPVTAPVNSGNFFSPAILNDTENTLDLVLVPGGHMLMSHPDLLRTNSGSLQLLPIAGDGRVTPGDNQADEPSKVSKKYQSFIKTSKFEHEFLETTPKFTLKGW